MKAKERCLKWLEFHFQKELLLFKSINVIFFANFLQSPGPGTYEIIDYGHIRNRGPSFSIHSRVEMPGDNTRKPGPGSHQPEKVRYPWLPTCYHGNISWIVRILLTYVAFLSYRLLRYSTALWSQSLSYLQIFSYLIHISTLKKTFAALKIPYHAKSMQGELEQKNILRVFTAAIFLCNMEIYYN